MGAVILFFGDLTFFEFFIIFIKPRCKADILKEV